MSAPYKLDQTEAVKTQISAIAVQAKKSAKSGELGRLLHQAIHLLQSDPHGWGDPEYRAKTVEALACRGILRPLAFHYVIYEKVRAVVLTSVIQYAEFD